ncbi:pre-toxin TG domain-containing protein [Zophobihabitans entericus]|uniref:Uncharacterized protein n=1 Tax=Zophobihabitans entericus TaxID=1635327 RepID=A0A6G9IB69_9GAMM|nr:pre-toxin TG domain-containing protein [Zophobihabitans entericus]QIQ21476.1 hypothetical protein IPMB12_07130 [Zophobihabitans entericus]
MERPQLEIDLEHQQLQRLLQENERQLELERLVQQKLPEAEENIQEQLKKQKNPIKDYTEEEQQALTKALSKKVAAKGHGYEVIYIAPYKDKDKDKDKDSHLIAYFDKNRPPAHINIQKTLREHQLEQPALVNNQQAESTLAQSDSHIKPDIKPTVPETIPEIEQEKTQLSVVAQQGDSAIKIAQKLDPDNPKQALGHLYQSGQIKDIKLKDEHQHVIPDVKPNKEYTYDPTIYSEQEKQLNEKLANKIMSQQTQINQQIEQQLAAQKRVEQAKTETHDANYLQSLFTKETQQNQINQQLTEQTLKAQEQFSLNNMVSLSKGNVRYKSLPEVPVAYSQSPMTVKKILEYQTSGESWGGNEYKTYEHFPGEKLSCAFASNAQMLRNKICVVTSESNNNDEWIVKEATESESEQYKLEQKANALALMNAGMSSPFNVFPNLTLGATEAIGGRRLWTGEKIDTTERAVEGALTVVGVFGVGKMVKPLSVTTNIESKTLRVTQFYDPKKGDFPIDGKFALSAQPTKGEQLIDGITTTTTWIAPFPADKMNAWNRMWTGVGNRTNYVEFDVLSSELKSPRNLKVWVSKYQKVIPEQVDLTHRNAVYGTLHTNRLDTFARYVGVPAGLGYSGYSLYKDLKKNDEKEKQ